MGVFYYPCSENKGADQLHGYREANLRLCFRICKKRFSHGAAPILLYTCPSGLVTVGFACESKAVSKGFCT